MVYIIIAIVFTFNRLFVLHLTKTCSGHRLVEIIPAVQAYVSDVRKGGLSESLTHKITQNCSIKAKTDLNTLSQITGSVEAQQTIRNGQVRASSHRLEIQLHSMPTLITVKHQNL